MAGMEEARSANREPPAATATSLLADICGEIAGAIRRAWGRGPANTYANWAGASALIVLLENGYTEHEKTLRAAGQTKQLLEGRETLGNILEDELKGIVERATGRKVIAMLSANRVDPDVSAQIFLFERPPTEDDPSARLRAASARTRARELVEEASAVHSQSRQAHRKRDGSRARDR